jgi:hypothetical protein
MLREHARWCETDGTEGKPSIFDRADLRNLKSIRGYNLTALSAKAAVFYGLDMEGRAAAGRAPRRALTCATAICAGPTCAARGWRAPSCPAPTCATHTWAPC